MTLPTKCSSVDASATPPTGTGAEPEDLGALIRGKNINGTSYLATDYLNHFGEVIMLLELLPDMPDCFDEIKEWQPKSYAQHFLDSGFQDAEIIVRAYENAPRPFRQAFDRVVAWMNKVILEGLSEIEKVLESGESDRLAVVVEGITSELSKLNGIAAGLINGEATTADQGTIDDIMSS